ncbi:MAG TPA: phosphotransferase, partial [Actinomycetaceae bacterium]|nr:phosphotransferase [Actinomycetaceae bacterium]
AHGLGRAVAEVHTALARIFPTHPADDGVRRALVGTWMSRAGAAVLTVPRLAEYRAQVSAAFDDALVSPWPALQRIHGDLHLGQVMSSPTRGWVLLDFEGEPLRPLAERRRNDVAIRDVAGMLRSFDYAAGPEPGAPRLEWTTRQRDAFLDGYAELAGDPREYSELLTAMELDKAFYEARYEAGNRPDWLPIPLRGIERLVR